MKESGGPNMEGYIQKWTNMVTRWKKRYMMLNGDILGQSKKKNGKLKHKQSISGSTIEMVPRHEKRLVIKMEQESIYLRTSTVAEKVHWVNALRVAAGNPLNLIKSRTPDKKRNKSPALLSRHTMGAPSATMERPHKEEEHLFLEKAEELKLKLIAILRNKLLLENTSLNMKLIEITNHEALLEENTSDLINLPILEEENLRDLKTRATDIQAIATDLKNGVMEAMGEIEEARVDIIHAVKDILRTQKKEQEAENMLNSFGESKYEERKEMGPDENSASETSFLEEVFFDCLDNELEHHLFSITRNVTEEESKEDPPTRPTLSVLRNPKWKFSLWAVLREMIGKDLTKLTMPVFFNEPLSFLQRVSEVMENEELLRIAARTEEPHLRMCYITGFIASQYSSTLKRKLKPFNPILGETYEYIPADKSYRLVVEQVSHHPPMTAFYCESEDYIVHFHTYVTQRFLGKSMEFKLNGRMHIILKGYKEHYTSLRPVTHARNLIIGAFYTDQVGNTEIINHDLNLGCQLNYYKRGWKEINLGRVQGVTYHLDRPKDHVYELKGKWTDRISATNLLTGNQLLIWERLALPEKHDYLYFFPLHTLQLNYLPKQMAKFLPPTDSRFRPDQRALEEGDMKLAAAEKNRLEEMQRARRKVLEQEGGIHVPSYFVNAKDPKFENEDCWLYNYTYWKVRDAGDWTNITDIF